jgi:hypothetical protein
MYWPNGVPRVYAVNGPDIAHVSSDRYHENTSPNTDRRSSIDNTDDAGDAQPPNTESYEPKPEPSSESDTPKWEHEPINGLCVSRSGHMFATITESSISLWQTRVCLEGYSWAWDCNRGALVLTVATAHGRRGCDSSVFVLVEDVRFECSTSNAPRLDNSGRANLRRLSPDLLSSIGPSNTRLPATVRSLYTPTPPAISALCRR